VGARAFSDYEWVFGIHEDRNHPHTHMMVKMRGREGEKKLQLRKADLYRLREMYAEAAREQGVQLAASPRAARGVQHKGLKQAVYHVRKEGKAIGSAKAVPEIANDPVFMKPWEQVMAARQKREMEAYMSEARSLRLAALSREGKDQEKLRSAAGELEEFALSMMSPKMRDKAQEKDNAGAIMNGRRPSNSLRKGGDKSETSLLYYLFFRPPMTSMKSVCRSSRRPT
jgi:hypothetical protein